MAEFYDDYLGSYDQGNSVQIISPHRAGARSKSNHVSRSDSRSASNSIYSHNGRSMRRKNSSRANPRAYTRARNNYEEEGYGSEEYDDGPPELTMIRVKVCNISFIHFGEHFFKTFGQLHYQDDIRGMTLTPDTPFSDFMDKVMAKFYKEAHGLDLKFKDEDGGRVTLRDDSDYELAIETARESAKGKAEGKLEIWCIDT